MRGYSFRWNHRRNRPGTELSEEEARARDAAGEEYTAVLPPRPGTRSPVLVTPVWQTGVVLVSFLDDPGRKIVEYVFTKKDDSRMFLSGVHLWEYPDDQPGRRLSEASRREDIRYHEDGYVHRTIIDKNEGYRETVEYTDVPVATNWEPVPAFGDYASIGRFERGRSPLNGAPPPPVSPG
ncbi:hypothetical protein ALI22I_17925 [Saccharothrix sp. ALI-22-I]|nr:hypothetical protein ALI22I_17925 [Saccharothrix sp. ALI-22-I]